MLLFGDDEFKTSDLIGNQSGFTRKKVFDNFIHSVVKMEDEVRQNWVDSRLTLACKEGFTLVYDEFNRSRPEVNNVLLSALEEKLLVLPPNSSRSEYIRVNPHFRAIFTSNPVEYCGVHSTQDALLDRLITITMPEPDELTQHEILVQKTEIDRESAVLIVQLVGAFRGKTAVKDSSGLRSCLMIAKICQEHGILASPGDSDFRELCKDVLLSRANQALSESTQILWDTFNTFTQNGGFLDSTASVAETPHPIEQLSETVEVAQPMPMSGDRPGHGEIATTETVEESPVTLESVALETVAEAEPAEPTSVNSIHDDGETIFQDESLTPTAETQTHHPEETGVAHHPECLETLELVDVSQAAVDVAQQLDTNDQPPAEPDGAEVGEPESAIADGRIASVTFAPGDDIDGCDAADQALADTIEAPYSDSLNTADVANVTESVTAPESKEGIALTVENAINLDEPFEQEVYQYLQTSNDTRPSQIEAALGISRFQTVNALRSLADRGLIDLHGNHAPRMRQGSPSMTHVSPPLQANYYPNGMASPSMPSAPSHPMGFRPHMTGGDFV
jgi:gas vesicle protein GvpN